MLDRTVTAYLIIAVLIVGAVASAFFARRNTWERRYRRRIRGEARDAADARGEQP